MVIKSTLGVRRIVFLSGALLVSTLICLPGLAEYLKVSESRTETNGGTILSVGDGLMVTSSENFHVIESGTDVEEQYLEFSADHTAITNSGEIAVIEVAFGAASVCIDHAVGLDGKGKQANIGSVVIDGKRTIAMGWMKMEETNINGRSGWPQVDNLELGVLDEAQKHGFDFVMQYYPWRNDEREYGANRAEILAYMDQAQARGVKIMIDIHGPALLDEITQFANIVKNHPALYGYYLGDEPDSRYWISGSKPCAPAELVLRYKTLRAEDPDANHPVAIAFAMNLPKSEAQSYFPACNLAFAECYPTAWNPTYPSEYPFVAADVSVAKSAGLEYMTVPRLFGDPYIDMPTPEEFKYMVFAPISVGAGGFMPHIYEGWVPSSPVDAPSAGFRDVIVYPATDILRDIRSTLVKGDLIATSNNADNDVTWVFGGDANEAVLVAVNNDPNLSKSSVDFTLSGLAPSVRTAEVLGEDRKMMLDANKSFKDSFDPYGVHVYQFRR